MKEWVNESVQKSMTQKEKDIQKLDKFEKSSSEEHKG